jgi:enoyl-CoA hydratase/carnithine racemase
MVQPGDCQRQPCASRMTDPPVISRIEDGVARITLNRPAVLNALDTPLAAALADHADRAAADPRVVAVVVGGAGRAFCSGIDRTAMAEGRVGLDFHRDWIRALNTFEDMPKVAIAVLHGYAIGGGLQLGLACDLRLAADTAVLGLGASEHGIIADSGVLRLARTIGIGRAKELALLNEHVTPAESLAMGLVNWVCAESEIDARLARLLARVKEMAPTATAHTKRWLHESFHRDPRTLVDDLLRSQEACFASGEADEANRAWMERRPARFYPPPASRA